MKVRIKFMSKEIKNENNILLKVLNIKKSYTQKKFLKNVLELLEKVGVGKVRLEG